MHLGLLVGFLALHTSFSPFSILWMVPRREKATSRAQGKCLAEPSQPEQTEARRKARYDKAFFNSVKDYHRYKQKFAQRKVVPGKSINFSQLQYFGFEGLFSRMGWLPVVTIFEPIFPTLVWAFYSRVTYGLEGSVISTVRGVKIRLSPKSICRILDIPSVGLLMYESKVWPTVLGFEPREAIQRLCGFADAQGMGKPLAHNLIVSNQVLHHMINSILLPRGRHRDEVSYLEAFIVDSILTRRWIHVRYLMMMHIISCCESTTWVLPMIASLLEYSRMSGMIWAETNFEAPNSYDTYDEQSMGRMKFEKAPDGS